MLLKWMHHLLINQNNPILDHCHQLFHLRHLIRPYKSILKLQFRVRKVFSRWLKKHQLISLYNQA